MKRHIEVTWEGNGSFRSEIIDQFNYEVDLDEYIKNCVLPNIKTEDVERLKGQHHVYYVTNKNRDELASIALNDYLDNYGGKNE